MSGRGRSPPGVCYAPPPAAWLDNERMTVRRRLIDVLLGLGLCWGILAACFIVAMLWLVLVVRDDYEHHHKPRRKPRWP